MTADAGLNMGKRYRVDAFVPGRNMSRIGAIQFRDIVSEFVAPKSGSPVL